MNCVNEKNKKWTHLNRSKYLKTVAKSNEKRKEYKADWFQLNKQKIYASIKKRNSLKPKKQRPIAKGKCPIARKAACDRYYLRHKDKCAERAVIWRNKNKDAAQSIVARRRAAKRLADVDWADRFIIKEIYHLAILRTKATGVKHEVDHIVPLQSKYVCGLHCEANLRVIPKSVNISKGNRIWPDMP